MPRVREEHPGRLLRKNCSPPRRTWKGKAEGKEGQSTRTQPSSLATVPVEKGVLEASDSAVGNSFQVDNLFRVWR